MTGEEIILLAKKKIEEKTKQNPNYIKFSYFEVRVTMNLSEEDTDEFLKAVFKELGEKYAIHYKGIKAEGGNPNVTLQNNELLIAVMDKV